MAKKRRSKAKKRRSEGARAAGQEAVQPAPVAAEADVLAVWNVGDVILDLYEVKQVHEGGAMGLVYRVHHRTWNMDLAVKSPRPEYFQSKARRENFQREAETWVNLDLHPHIVSCRYVRRLGGRCPRSRHGSCLRCSLLPLSISEHQCTWAQSAPGGVVWPDDLKGHRTTREAVE